MPQDIEKKALASSGYPLYGLKYYNGILYFLLCTLPKFVTDYQNLSASVRFLLKKIPVYIIRDYSISIYGAANAAVSLLG